MSGNNILRYGESKDVTVRVTEDINQPSLLDLNYWLWGRRRFEIAVTFPKGCTFKGEKLYIVETHISPVASSEISFGVIVHGSRQLECSDDTTIITSKFDAYLPSGVKTVGCKLLTECEGKTTCLSLN